MKKRPVHGRLFQQPSSRRLISHGPRFLDNLGIEGTSIRVPDPPPRPHPFPSSDLCCRLGKHAGGQSREGSTIVCTDVGDVRVVITPRVRQRLSALDLQHSPITARLGLDVGLIPPLVGMLVESRTVRFEAPRTASNSPQPMVLPEQIEVPLAVYEEDTTLLEGESFELVQAQEELQERVVMVAVTDVTSPVNHVLDPPPIVSDPVAWPEVVEERMPTPEPEPEVVEAVPEEEPLEDLQDDPDSQPVATSSPRQPIKTPTPRPPPIPTPALIEEPTTTADSNSSSSPEESLTPPPSPPPVMARRPTVVEGENTEEDREAEKANLVGLMSRLSTLQRAKPKPKPKKERPPPEKPPRPAPRPKPVERPPLAPPKPVKPAKPPPPKPVVKEPRPPKPKPPPREKKIMQDFST
ncbi:hypothetical protein ACOMHN_014413 [Nucella lapillus]